MSITILFVALVSASLLHATWMSESRFATCSVDKTIILCDIVAAVVPADGSAPAASEPRSIVSVRTLSAHASDVNVLAWNRTASVLASASDDSTAIVWSADGDLLHQLAGHAGGVQVVQWCPSTNAQPPSLLATYVDSCVRTAKHV